MRERKTSLDTRTMVESRMTPLLSLLLSFSILFLVLVSIGDSLSSSLLLVSETFTEEKRLLHALHMTQVSHESGFKHDFPQRCDLVRVDRDAD